jgi:hypothetical protein
VVETGAVNKPVVLIVPVEALHLTDWLHDEGVTVAVNCCDPPARMVTAPGLIVTVQVCEKLSGIRNKRSVINDRETLQVTFTSSVPP